MIAVVQRVSSASVDVPASHYHTEIGAGLLVLIAIEPRDGDREVEWMAKKLARLRVFADTAARMNLSVVDIDGSLLLVSQFTLAGNCTKGNRPSFIAAADPAQAEPLCEQLARAIREHGLPVQTGVFGAAMRVECANEGPVTLIIHTPER